MNLISRDQIWAIAFLFRDFHTIVSRATVFLEVRTFSAQASKAVRVDEWIICRMDRCLIIHVYLF